MHVGVVRFTSAAWNSAAGASRGRVGWSGGVAGNVACATEENLTVLRCVLRMVNSILCG